MNIREVLSAAGYVAIDRVVGTEPISNMPCPFVEHKKQGLNYGPARIYPPKADDPGGMTCLNCGQNWSTIATAKELGISKEVLAGRERYVPPREPKRIPKDKKPVEPIDIRDTWVKALAGTTQSRHAWEYFKRRWHSDELAEGALKHIGWTAAFPQEYWKRYKQYNILVPLYDKDGAVVSGIRRFNGIGSKKLKALRIPNEAVALPSGTPVWLGDPPPAAAKYATGATLYLAEGEVDTLLLLAMREAGLISGGILGSPGGASQTKEWWDHTAKLFDEAPESVVMALDSDAAGDKYWQKSAGSFPNAQRVFMPDRFDLTDVMAKHGQEEVVNLLNAAKHAHFRFYRLDSGKFAYLCGDQWYMGVGRESLMARLHAAGYDDEEAKLLCGNLPPARDICFNPTTLDPVVIRNSNTYLNQFRGLPLSADEGDCQLYEWLLFWLCNEEDADYNYALDWLARPLQNIYSGRGAYRNKTALIFHGDQGTGKGFAFGTDGIMRAIYGNTMSEILQGQMEDHFEPNKLTETLLLTANEVACSGYRDAKTLNRLKAWVTEPTIQIRRMRKTSEEFPIWFNMVMLSNDDMPIRLEPGDRRYSVFKQDKKLDPSLIGQFVKERDDGWPRAKYFLKRLLDRAIERDLAVPFTNEDRDRLLDAGRPSQIVFAEAILELGLDSIIADFSDEMDRRGRTGEYYNPGTGFIGGQTLMELYQFWCKQVGTNYPVRLPSLYSAITKVMPDVEVSVIGVVGRRRMRGAKGLPVQAIRQLDTDMSTLSRHSLTKSKKSS